jgi:RNA polymerase sigma-70 factor (ECF subfamily)
MIPNGTQTVSTASQELALVRGAARGDRRCFEQLVQFHVPKVHRIVHRMLGNESDVEDVMQEALLKAFTHLRHFRGEARFGTWLYSIAANQAMQLHRERRTRRFVASDDIERPVRDPLASAEERMEKVELCRRVNERIAHLSAEFRAVVHLFYFEDLSVRETAQRLGLSEAGTKTRLFRARARLARMLEPSAPRSRTSWFCDR